MISNSSGVGQKSTKSVFLNKLSKKSEKTPLNIKGSSNKSRNIGGLKDIGWNAYSNNQPSWNHNEILGYELSSSNSYSMAGRTMIHKINTPTKYSVIHGKGTGLFASYNRSIPKNGVAPPNNKIRINNFCEQNKSALNNPPSKLRKHTDASSKSKSKVRSNKEGSPSHDENYSQTTSQEYKDKVGCKKIVKMTTIGRDRSKEADKQGYCSKEKRASHCQDISEFRLRSGSNTKNFRYTKDRDSSNSSNHKSSGK